MSYQSPLPPIPTIPGDHQIVVDVWCHSSLLRGGDPLNEEYGDTERLAVLGAKVFDMAITYHWFSKKPMLSANEIKVRLHCPFRVRRNRDSRLFRRKL